MNRASSIDSSTPQCGRPAAEARVSGLPGLYVHVPFCKTKCPYCDFYSIAQPGLVKPWLDGVLLEACHYAALYESFDTVYFGGGTPSLLDVSDIAALMAGLSKHFRIAPDAEITIEVNPDDVTREKLIAWQQMGINRISIGAQSLDDGDLKLLGRRHDAARAEEALEQARECGFENVGVDLIYGLNAGGQSWKSLRARWEKTVSRVLRFRPEHLSCYQLTIEEGTIFGRMRARGKLTPLGEAKESALFTWTSELFESSGYIHYEISNFARGREHISRHNSKYWHHIPYLGLGPAAHSFLDGKRWWNVRSVEDYCRLLASGRKPVAELESLTHEQLELETLYLGLRTQEGIDEAILSSKPGLGAVLSELTKSGILEARNGRLLPTRKGFLVADSLPLLLAG